MDLKNNWQIIEYILAADDDPLTVEDALSAALFFVDLVTEMYNNTGIYFCMQCQITDYWPDDAEDVQCSCGSTMYKINQAQGEA